MERGKMRLLLATHLIASLAGWWVMGAIQENGREAPNETASKSVRREAGGVATSGGEILEAYLRKEPAAADPSGEPPQLAAWRASQEEFARGFRDLKDSLAPRGDVGGAAKEALAKLREGDDRDPEAAVRILQWLRANRAEAWAFLEAADRSYGLGATARAAIQEALEETTVTEAAALLGKDIGSSLQYSLLTALAEKLGEGSDVESLGLLVETLSPAVMRRLGPAMLEHWSVDRADDLVVAAMATNQPQLVAQFAQQRMDAEAGRDWLQAVLASQADPQFLAKVVKNDSYKSFYKQQRELPYAERLAAMVAVDGGTDLEAAATKGARVLALADVSALLNSGRDWRYAFRHGEVSATEVLEIMRSALPELAARNPEALAAKLYGQLGEEDPERAVELLNSLPESERNREVLLLANWNFANIAPDDFYEQLQQVPPRDDPEEWRLRMKAWETRSGGHYGIYSDDYVDWVRGLPAGLDRDMALHALAKVTSRSDAALAAELRREVRDQQVRARFEP